MCFLATAGHYATRAGVDKRMEWHTLDLEHPQVMLAALIVAAICATVVGLGSRHTHAARWGALLFRVAVGACICLLLAVPSSATAENRLFEPAGTWRLILGEAPPAREATDFCESPVRFAARVRDALAGGRPPSLCEVHGNGTAAIAAYDALRAMGMPCSWVSPVADESAQPMIAALDAPRLLQPGEPAEISASLTGAGQLEVTLDGTEISTTRDGNEVRAMLPGLAPGKHTVEATLHNQDGQVLHRTGAVLRVGERPRLLLLGLSEPRAEEAAALAPAFDTTRCTPAEFDEDRVGAADVVLAGIDALNALSSRQAFVLSGFVARGGGLYVTGDGARHVSPQFLPQDIVSLLPVTLLPEPKPETPPTPPVIDKPTVTEIAKVSICYVIDRSGSMDALIGNSGLSRWRVACKGVVESMMKLSVDARASVMAFTLKQNWLTKDRAGKPEPRVFLEGNRRTMDLALSKLESDGEFDDAWFNTDIYAAMEAAIGVMKDEPSAVKMIIMLTDGGDRPATQVAGKRHSDLRDLAEKNGINIVAIGIGEGFSGDTPEAVSARAVINDLATRPRHDPRRSFAFMPASAEDAARAHVIFVNSVDTAFEIFDDKKKREEEERQNALLEQKKDNEPPKVEALGGTFPLVALEAGTQIFGPNAIPPEAPKLRWYARNLVRRDAVAALGIQTDDASPPAALALGSWGYGRVAFWSAGTSAESLGEVAGWAEFGGLFAASLRWLTPPPMSDLEVVKDASTEGLLLSETTPGATYALAAPDGATLELTSRGALLASATGPIPEGSFELFETRDGHRQSLGDVYVSLRPKVGSRFELNHISTATPLNPLSPVQILRRHESHTVILYVGALILILLSMERLVRRRV